MKAGKERVGRRWSHLSMHAALVAGLAVGLAALLALGASPAWAGEVEGAAAPLPLQGQVSRRELSCVQTWRSAYTVEAHRNCTLTVTLRIRLDPREGVSEAELAAAKTRWARAIARTWSGQFPLVAERPRDLACPAFGVAVRVQWVETGEHHTVQVYPGAEMCDIRRWYLGRPDASIAHEAGHMLGLPDEYPSRLCPRGGIQDRGSIMYFPAEGQVRPRHYAHWAAWLSAKIGVRYEVAS